MDAVAPLVDRQPKSKKFVDMTGRRFGKLTVINFAGFQGKIPKWKCSCSCGGERLAFSNHLLQGRIQHCGCDSARTFDGRSSHPLWGLWNGMRQRCSNPNGPAYELYGGRGITVAKEFDDFWAFVKHMGPRPSDAHSVGRIDNDGNYEPGNVQWETREQQARNTRRNVYIKHGGERLTMSQWADRLGITREAMRLRLKKKATIESMVTTPKGEIVNDEWRAIVNSIPLTDDAQDKFPFEVGKVYHAVCDTDGLEILEQLRRIALAAGMEFRSRCLDSDILFRFTST